MKKILALLCLPLSAMLYACHSEEPPPAPPAFDKPVYSWGSIRGKTLTIRGNRDDLSRPYLQRAFERYQALTGNTLRVEGLSNRELAENLPAAFLAGSAPRPDLLLSFGGVNIEKLNPDDNFYDFTDAPWVDDLTDTAINQAVCRGRIIGLPYWEASISGTLYNKKLFRQFGLAVPETQEEFLTLCKTLLRNGVTPVYLPYAEPTMLLYQFPMDSLLEDSRTLEALNAERLSYAQMRGMHAIVSWYKTMADRGYFGRDYERNDWAGMDAAMRSGRYAMMLGWDTWLYTDFSGNATDFGLMPAFMGVPDEGSYEGPNLALLLVDKHSPRLDAALDFITFLADPYNYNAAFEGLYTAPVFKNQIGSISTPQYVEEEPRINRLLRDSTAWLRVRGFAQLDASCIQRHMQDPAYGVEDCLNDMDAARRRRAAGQNRDDGHPG